VYIYLKDWVSESHCLTHFIIVGEQIATSAVSGTLTHFFIAGEPIAASAV
jgi:hypothetical protein